MKKFVILSALFSSLLITQNSSADTIAQWTFETSIPTNAGPYAPEIGAGSASSFHASGSAVFSNPVGNGSFESYSANFWSLGDFFEFSVSTLTFQEVIVSWDQTRSSSGPATFSFGWSTNGTDFTIALADYTVPAVSWSSGAPDITLTSSFLVDLSSVSALNDQASVFFRLIDTAATGATGGTGRIDNFTVTAIPVPEPSAAVLGGLGLLAVFMAARRRK